MRATAGVAEPPAPPHAPRAQAEGSRCGGDWDSPGGQDVRAAPSPVAPPALLLCSGAVQRLFRKQGSGSKAVRNAILTEFLLCSPRSSPGGPGPLGGRARTQAAHAPDAAER